MMLSWFDIVAIVIVALNVVRGAKDGGIVMLGNIASIIVGFLLTAHVVAWVNEHWLAGWSSSHPIASIIAFVVVFLAVVKLLRLAVSLLNSAFRIISIIPLVSPLNRLIGAAIGLVEGAVIVLIVVYVVASYLHEVLLPSGITYETGTAIINNIRLFFPSMVLGTSL